ncbi:hypothetical protein [Actinomadura sp. BRA 177]|uniref:hypothetical protein n=1 Tax=Actinomadura sp. BRA 177 TaxID=2745202 RepID=UPI00159624F5|nr:hypothetical protein [Actinomadura sp. BRA 177]NVI90347.1 hypothetical protein [Actinomadura sp. BRA 177]
MADQMDRPTVAYRIFRDWFATFATAFVAALAARLVMGGSIGPVGGVLAFSALLATVLVGIRFLQHRYKR